MDEIVERTNGRKITPAIESEFNQIMQIGGGLLRAQDVVESAASPTSPMHSWFTWDDTDAARKWRLQEARQLISSYQIYAEELSIKVRALTSLEIDRARGGGYRWTMQAMERPELRDEILRRALKDLQAVRSKYRHLQELAQVWSALDNIEV